MSNTRSASTTSSWGSRTTKSFRRIGTSTADRIAESVPGDPPKWSGSVSTDSAAAPPSTIASASSTGSSSRSPAVVGLVGFTSATTGTRPSASASASADVSDRGVTSRRVSPPGRSSAASRIDRTAGASSSLVSITVH